MNLELKAKHFKDTTYCGVCAIEKALNEFYPGSLEFVDGCEVKGKDYAHEKYGFNMFREDQLKAESMQPEDVVRVIEIEELEAPGL